MCHNKKLIHSNDKSSFITSGIQTVLICRFKLTFICIATLFLSIIGDIVVIQSLLFFCQLECLLSFTASLEQFDPFFVNFHMLRCIVWMAYIFPYERHDHIVNEVLFPFFCQRMSAQIWNIINIDASNI